jgi:demethylmenaquinone methyltransferase/2-methoxy-6-polyprenyl-1,4-benzoquinol methylase
MTDLVGKQRSRYVQDMFARIAPHYDLMNRLMTAGQDARWRKEVVERAILPPGGKVLDLGAGTGDLAQEALAQFPACVPVAADFTLEMMQVGRQRYLKPSVSVPVSNWSAADAHILPFASGTFDAVVSGFLFRNLAHVMRSLQEQHRVLKSGGRIVILDTTPPPDRFYAPLIRFHLHTVIPLLGSAIAGNSDAYTYLPDSTEHFLAPEKLANKMLLAGFHKVAFRRLMFGAVAIHWGEK